MTNLNTPLEKIFKVAAPEKKGLKKLGIETAKDLLFHFPSRYDDLAEIKNIAELKEGDDAIIYGKILTTKTSKAYRKKIPLTEASIKDQTGTIKAVWFHQAYIAKMLPAGSFAKLKGKVTKRGSSIYLANPEFEKTKELPIDSSDSLFQKSKEETFFYPIYPESKGVSSRWLHYHIQEILRGGDLSSLKDPIPGKILKKYNLPTLGTALVWIHSPKKETDAMAARKRFAFEEIFFIQLARQSARKEYEKNPSFKIKISKDDIARFIDRFPFNLTEAQQNSIEQIAKDLASNKPMSRLLEGDVGSGKTAVAATTTYAVISTQPEGQDFGNLQVAYMAPTEILAKQHFAVFIEYFKYLPINIGLITGSGCKKFPSKVNPGEATNISRAQLLKWVANGEIPILIGTHALIQKTVKFEDLAYVIIDEQHRFGTEQRMKLVRKDGRAPHLLSMTATPIPRTLALTIYGDLDLTLLDQMPKGRKEIITEIVLPAQREKVYEKVRKELESGRQVYVICPRINEPDPNKALALHVKSVKEEAKRLKKDIFQKYEIDILHSKMTPKEKEETMQEFSEGEINILVATSVVEVGVNVPNATVIIIEGAERFGLAQLHQLRGRVLRSNHQAYCFAFNDTDNKKSIERLRALKTAKNGFELSELDLNLRGAGELSGKKQWGISDLGMEAIKNIKMVEAARKEAQELLQEDSSLKNYREIQDRLASQKTEVHFE
jgi:ATP-dependent DNA helicase RecG